MGSIIPKGLRSWLYDRIALNQEISYSSVVKTSGVALPENKYLKITLS
jgi:hypothetical protein